MFSMIFLLDIILVLNIVLAYKRFRFFLSPPVLWGGGMLLASIVVTFYYREWEIDKLSFETVFFVGFGTLFFTVSCLLFQKKTNHYLKNDFDERKILFNKKRLTILLCILILLCIYNGDMRMMVYRNYFGNSVDESSLLQSARVALMWGEIEMPFAVSFLSRALFCFFIIISWVLTEQLFSPQKDKKFIVLCIVFLVTEIILSARIGDKISIVERVMIFITIYSFEYLSKGKKKISGRLLLKLGVVFVLFIYSFNSFNELVGRSDFSEVDTKSSLVSIYMGAEIKNFDTYIRDDNNKNTRTVPWGGYTFSQVYKKMGVKLKNQHEFQHVGFYDLGNVYTTYFYFHRDFGGIGVFILTFIVAGLSMFLYNKSMFYIKMSPKQNYYLYIYSICTTTLFMAFFSSRFTERFFSVRFIVDCIFLYLIILFFDNFFKRKPA